MSTPDPAARATRALLMCLAAVLVARAAPSPARTPGVAEREGREIVERAYRANNIGVAWLEQFNFPRAADAFQDSLRLVPSLAMARFNLALALFYDGRLAAAEQEVRASATVMRGSPFPDYLLALIARAQGRTAVAVAALDHVLAADPDDVGANLQLAQIRLQEGDARRAVSRFEAAFRAEPHNATAAYGLAVALPRAGRADDGRRMLARFQALRESGAGTTLGSSYLQQGRYAEALVSTGAEPELVDRTPPDVRFVEQTLLRRRSAAADVSPLGRRFDAADLNAAGRRRIAAALAGGILLFDFDTDGDLDLLEVDATEERLWRNTGGRFAHVPARFRRRSGDSVGMSAVAGDYDNDGRPDLLVLRFGGVALYRNEAAGRWADVTETAGLTSGATELPLAAAFADLDHDGDLDILLPGYVDLAAGRAGKPVVFPDEFPSVATRVWRNNGNATFTDVTAASGVSFTRASAVVPTDYDNARDVDLVIAGDAAPLALFKNQRDGSFRDVAREAGLAMSGRLAALAADDVNRDGRTDFVVGRSEGGALLALSSGRSRFRLEPAPAGLAGVTAAQVFDYDNDGLTDLLAWSGSGARLLRNVGDGWQEVTTRALPESARAWNLPHVAAGRALAIADVDGDGDQDVVVRRASGIQVLRNEGGHRAGSLHIRLSARVSNRSAAGAKLEVRAGSLKQRRELYAATPPPAPVDAVFGLGGRSSADAVRVVWPAGIVQAELEPSRARPLLIRELDRKPSSCPYLFAWDGERFRFVTDFLGGGELGYWVAPGLRSQPDSDEYVRLPGDAVRARDGRYELRITNELEEVLYLDHVRLEVVAHPDGYEVYPNEGLVPPPRPPHTIYAVRAPKPPAGALDEHGHDVRSRLAALDRRSVDDFALAPIRGHAEPHALTLALPAGKPPADAILLSGWTDYAFSSDNVAASQRGLELSPPALQVRDGAGRWRTVLPNIGVPVGRPQTLVVDLRRPDLRSARELRVVTNMRIYWDRVAVATLVDAPRIERQSLAPLDARLRWRGFSEPAPDGRPPPVFDYARISAVSPWKTMTGRYTREGDVRELVAAVDDRFVVARPGDEIALQFEADALPAPPQGWTRTFLLYADGFSKEMDLNSAGPDRVEPLPYHAMPGYPPAGGSNPHGPMLDDAARVAPSHVLSIDSFLLLARGFRGDGHRERTESRR